MSNAYDPLVAWLLLVGGQGVPELAQSDPPEAEAWAVSRLGRSHTEWMFGQSSSAWDRWLCRHDAT